MPGGRRWPVQTPGPFLLTGLLSEAFLGQHLETVELEGREPEPGDLFLFRLMAPTGRWCGAHVGVYCGHGEIIHFEGKSFRLKQRPSLQRRPPIRVPLHQGAGYRGRETVV
ncbi:hypothetical protein D623_10013199 [Myotis brandtii]|uniref:NlpC/P60 domain-containing protein n=1 Tax=Myotis brandtii TaxID=109478 RepID=S7ND57_MYOBR|nr:hypothetical protein D623_10013199 [Myotis brandtii]